MIIKYHNYYKLSKIFVFANIPDIEALFSISVLLRTVKRREWLIIHLTVLDVCPWRENNKTKAKMIINYQNQYKLPKTYGNGLDKGCVKEIVLPITQC